MTTPVEAASLSSLTTLFANPPQYPRNPTHQLREPLILYIVRVPGSKDVFLTPLKPSTKASISAEAINASLYYLHVDTEEDEIVRESLEEQRAALQAAGQAPIPIARKPLPDAPFENYPKDRRPPTPPKSYPHFQPAPTKGLQDTQAGRYAMRGQAVRFTVSNTSPTGFVKQKPIGPRPLQDRLESDDNAPIRRKPVVHIPRNDENAQPLYRDSASQSSSHCDSDESTASAYQTPPLLPPRPGWTQEPAGRPDQALDITLIRRDPASNSQWNIGSISHEVGVQGTHQNSFKIRLTTPGYQRFSKQVGIDSFYTSLAFSSASSIKDLATSTPVCITPVTPTINSPFSRDVSLTQPQTFLQKGKSYDQRSSADWTTSNNTGSRRDGAKVGLRNHNFTFASPWDGICTFSTGVNGRSLKCRHTLPTQTTVSSGSSTAVVAEIRFDLPWSVLQNKEGNTKRTIGVRGHGKSASLASVLGSEKTETLKQNMKRFSQKAMNEIRDAKRGYSSEPGGGQLGRQPTETDSRDDSDDEDDEEDRLGLGLGREKAGGGRSGRNAKLGKLVIEDEGLKMCDLVVAACMGVWWQHYMAKRCA